MTPPKGTLVRAGGVALAGVMPSVRLRAAVLASSYAAGWVVGPHGFQLLSVSGVQSGNPLLREGVPMVTSTLSWTAAQVVALAGLRALPLPSALTSAAYAGLLTAMEPRVLAAAERGTAAAARQAESSGPR